MALRTCSAATDGTGYNGCRAAVITVGVYVLVHYCVYKTSGTRTPPVVCNFRSTLGPSHCPPLYPIFICSILFWHTLNMCYNTKLFTDTIYEYIQTVASSWVVTHKCLNHAYNQTELFDSGTNHVILMSA